MLILKISAIKLSILRLFFHKSLEFLENTQIFLIIVPSILYLFFLVFLQVIGIIAPKVSTSSRYSDTLSLASFTFAFEPIIKSTQFPFIHSKGEMGKLSTTPASIIIRSSISIGSKNKGIAVDQIIRSRNGHELMYIRPTAKSVAQIVNDHHFLTIGNSSIVVAVILCFIKNSCNFIFDIFL